VLPEAGAAIAYRLVEFAATLDTRRQLPPVQENSTDLVRFIVPAARTVQPGPAAIASMFAWAAPIAVLAFAGPAASTSWPAATAAAAISGTAARLAAGGRGPGRMGPPTSRAHLEPGA